METLAIQKQLIDCIERLDEEHAHMVLMYIESLDKTTNKKSLKDIRGKIEFSDGYDYKSMRE